MCIYLLFFPGSFFLAIGWMRRFCSSFDLQGQFYEGNSCKGNFFCVFVFIVVVVMIVMWISLNFRWIHFYIFTRLPWGKLSRGVGTLIFF